MDVSRYLGLFVNDARENVAGLDSSLVRMEAAAGDERREHLDRVFRHLHSLKSSAATMGFDSIAQLAHHSESLVVQARTAELVLTQEHLDLLLQVTDAMRMMVESASAGTSITPRPDLLARLHGPREKTPGPLAPVATPAPTRPAGPHTVVQVGVSQKSSTPAARAFLALRKLEQVGDVIDTNPTREALREGRLPGYLLTLTLRGEHTTEALKRALARVPDLDGVEILPALPEPPRDLKIAPAASLRVATDQTIRVNVELLDHLLELGGELVLASARVRESVRVAPENVRGPMIEEADHLRRLVKELNNSVLATRQTPVQNLAERLPRVIRDLSRTLNKPVELHVEGTDVTLDRGLLDALTDPLLHTLRNAVDHGLEAPEDRVKLGKPPSGQLWFVARRERDHVIVELRDDGRGFDIGRLRKKAVQAGVRTVAEVGALTDAAALRLALLPGVSTREASTELSGRGVGMDVVLRSIEQLGGALVLESKPGAGSCVRFVLPATVSVTNVLLIGLQDEVFGVPMSRVLSAVEIELPAPDSPSGRNVHIGGEHVPAFALGRLIGLPEKSALGIRPTILVEGEGLRAAIGVDSLLGQEEVVLRPISPPLERIRGLAGTAILGSGRPIFILDVPRLVA